MKDINSGNRDPGYVQLYNNVAIEEFGDRVYYTDLYTPILPHLDDWSIDGTHFNSEGNQFNAQNVVNGIDTVMLAPVP